MILGANHCNLIFLDGELDPPRICFVRLYTNFLCFTMHGLVKTSSSKRSTYLITEMSEFLAYIFIYNENTKLLSYFPKRRPGGSSWGDTYVIFSVMRPIAYKPAVTGGWQACWWTA